MTQIYLNQQRQALSAFFEAQAIEPPGQFYRVERMDDVKEVNGAPGLVSLKVSDEVPTNIGLT